MRYLIFGVSIFMIAMVVIGITTFKGKDKPSKKIRKDVTAIIPIRTYDERNACFTLSDGSVFDLLKIKGKDLKNASREEVEYDILKFSRMYKLLEGDVKIIVMNYPVNTSLQVQNLEAILSRTKNPIFQSFLEEKIRELKLIGKTFTAREYYLGLFFSTPELLDKERLSIKASLHTGRDGLIEVIEKDKKVEIIKRLYNKNILALGRQ